MRVLIIGATGGVGTYSSSLSVVSIDLNPISGLQLIDYMLRESHTVVIYARTPSKLPESITSNPSVKVVKGELGDREALKGALTGVDAVLSALGPSVKKGPLHPSGTPLAKAYVLILEVMKEVNVKRLILLGTASMKDPNDKFNLEFWVLVNGVAAFAHNAYKVNINDISSILLTASQDVVAIGETVRADHDILWTIVRVPILTDKDEDRFVAGYVGDKKTKAWLPRKGFAAFVAQELKSNEWVQKQPLLSTP